MLALRGTGQPSQHKWCLGSFPCGTITFSADSFIINLPVIDSGEVQHASACYNSYRGDFLFTNGRWIWDEHGNTISGGGKMYYSSWVDFADAAPNGLAYRQSVLFLPSPRDSNKVYLFNIYPEHAIGSGSNYYEAPENVYFNIINLRGTNNQPEVTLKCDSILHKRMLNGHLTATRHANGRDWWVVCHGYNTNTFYKFLITGDTVGPAIQQNIGSVMDDKNFFLGNGCFSPDGEHYVIISGENGKIELYNFNRCSGEFTSLQQDTINRDNSPVNVPVSGAFSPSGRYYYVNTLYKLYQYDIDAPSFATSRLLIDTSDHYREHPSLVQGDFGYLALAPNNKIYLSPWAGIELIHEINYPDSAGKSCHFVQHFDTLLPYGNSGPPNVVNYDLGATALYQAGAGPGKTILSGQSILIGTSSVNGVLYQWNPTSGLSDPYIAQPIATPLQTTTYYLTITDTSGGSGCYERVDSMTVFVADPGCEVKFQTLLLLGENLRQLNYSERYAVSIFNALGQLVFSSDDYKGEWWPMINGFYAVKLQCENGEVRTHKLIVE